MKTVYRTRIKICGITREQDLDAIVAAGADAVGFVLYPKSPRYVSPERAAELARRLGISPEAVCQWKGKVPVNRVIAVEAATGVSREHLRPDGFAVPRPAQRRAP